MERVILEEFIDNDKSKKSEDSGESKGHKF